MRNYKNIIWVVPLYCVIVGVISFHTAIAMLARFAMEKLPDGTVTTNDAKTMLIYGVIFLCVVLLGKRLFRFMTKREIFVSASILVVFQFIIMLIQCCIGKVTLTFALVFMYLSEISEWSGIIPLILWKVTHNIWIGQFVNVFAPYIFVLFGLKELEKEQKEEIKEQ